MLINTCVCLKSNNSIVGPHQCQYHHEVHLSFAKKFSQLFIYYGASFTFENFVCTSVGIKNSVLNKYIKTIR